MMKKSAVHQQYQASYYEAYRFDLQEDFSPFLEEAKHHAKEAKLKSSSMHPEESRKRKTGSEKERREKKSWKSSLISRWKADKKSKLRGEPTNNSQAKVSGKRQGQGQGQGHVSGPIPIYNCGKVPDVKHWRPISGPLTSLFKSTKREESEIAYMSLQQNSPPAVDNYGPLYVVT